MIEHDKYSQKQRELYQVKIELEEERCKNRKLIAQLSRDYENSSISSTGRECFKKIRNSREKTGRKPGAQPGHKGYCRKRLLATEHPVLVTAPEAIISNPDYYLTGKEIRKQVVDVTMIVTVTEYLALEYETVKPEPDIMPNLCVTSSESGYVF